MLVHSSTVGVYISVHGSPAPITVGRLKVAIRLVMVITGFCSKSRVRLGTVAVTVNAVAIIIASGISTLTLAAGTLKVASNKPALASALVSTW